MKGKNFNSPGQKPRVLVAPIDWGLGHATRSIPVINGLINTGCEVIVAAEGAARILLQKEFPSIPFVELKGYRMRYSYNRSWMPLVLFFQVPKVAWRVYREQVWLKKAVKELSIDAVISDSRLGMYHASVPCVYMVHQLKIKTGGRFTERLIQKVHYRFINKYRECWVPDTGGGDNLAGELSHPVDMPRVPVKYIGPLSRFEKSGATIMYDLLIILSGPEPQRTLFEKTLLRELQNFSGRALLVRGLPGNKDMLKSSSSAVTIKDHLSAAELNEAILQSAMIICRSGYTSVMDLIKLQKPAILVPTPGQTEQEYLADYLMQQKFFLCVPQDHFSLSNALDQVRQFPFIHPVISSVEYERIVTGFVQSLA